MWRMSEPATAAEAPADELDADADAAIGACDDDVRAAVKTLLVALHEVEQRPKIEKAISTGYAGRGVTAAKA
jgi:hypothetical protein